MRDMSTSTPMMGECLRSSGEREVRRAARSAAARERVIWWQMSPVKNMSVSEKRTLSARFHLTMPGWEAVKL